VIGERGDQDSGDDRPFFFSRAANAGARSCVLSPISAAATIKVEPKNGPAVEGIHASIRGVVGTDARATKLLMQIRAIHGARDVSCLPCLGES
jgi:hypothetical protein